MTAIFFDLDNCDNPMNGTTLKSGADVFFVFETLHHRRPFIFQLQLDDGSKLDIGVSEHVGCVQHSPSDSMPPYRMVTKPTSSPLGRGDTEFSVGGTATPIDNRYCIPVQDVLVIVKDLLNGRSLPEWVTWEDV